MRRALLPAWPALAHHFNLHPPDLEWLTYDEIEAYLEALRDIADANGGRTRPQLAQPVKVDADGMVADGGTIPVVRR